MIISSIIAALFASAIMTYISLATPLGPWIEPTFVMIALVLLKIAELFITIDDNKKKELLVCISASAGIAGITAVGCSFSFPTIFFLEPDLFKQWIAEPVLFITALAGFLLIGGFVAFSAVSWWEKMFLSRDDLPFPEPQLINKTIESQDSYVRGVQLLMGACLAGFLSLLNITTSLMLLALGFVTGYMIAIPLIVGTLCKIGLVIPLNNLVFTSVKSDHMIMAWCAGMVVYGAFIMFAEMVLAFKKKYQDSTFTKADFLPIEMTIGRWLLAGTAIALVIVTFSQFSFTVPSVIYLLIGTLICSYQLTLIAGKIGLAPLGRFATFVMLPGIMLFGYTSMQATLVATFVEVCGGVCVELMFGRKLQNLTSVRRIAIIRSQIIGLVIGAITIAVIFWLLAVSYGLGVPPLVAQRSAARALLIRAHDFNVFIVLCGMIFGALLHHFKVNPVLAITGLLLPLDYVFPLIIGGLCGLISNRERYYPFWSGIFVASSLSMIIKAFLGL